MSTQSPGHEREAVVDAVAQHAESPGWQQAKRKYFGEYVEWGERHGLAPHHLDSGEALALWLTSEHGDWAWKMATYVVCAIGSAFVDQGRPNPRHGPFVRRVLAAYRHGRRRVEEPTRPFGPAELVVVPVRLSVQEAQEASLAATLAILWLTRTSVARLAEFTSNTVRAEGDVLQLGTIRLCASAGPVHAAGVRAAHALVQNAPQGAHPLLWPLTGTAGACHAGQYSETELTRSVERLLSTSADRVGLGDRGLRLLLSGGLPAESLMRLWMCAGVVGGVRRTRDRALLLCGLGHRAIDLSRIDLKTVVPEDQRHVALLPRSKSDPGGRGRILVWDHTGSPYCPHCALQDWLIVLDHASAPLPAALFPGIRGEDLTQSRLSSDVVTKVIRAHCARVGLDPNRYSSRSLRVGGATALARAGADLEEIAAVTGHETAEAAAMYWRLETIEPARLDV